MTVYDPLTRTTHSYKPAQFRRECQRGRALPALALWDARPLPRLLTRALKDVVIMVRPGDLAADIRGYRWIRSEVLAIARAHRRLWRRPGVGHWGLPRARRARRVAHGWGPALVGARPTR
jgi:hypothetical protein